MNNVKALLGKRIQALRKEKKLSQAELAEFVGIEPNNLSRIENGKNYPTPENIAKIANSLDIEIYELYKFNHYKTYEEIKSELINIIEDENYARLLYKFYATLKM